jgi:hypothetical protein
MAICGGLYAISAYALRLPEVDRWVRVSRRIVSRLTNGRI